MGRSRYKVVDPQLPHFITCTVLHWIPVFTRPETVEVVLESLRFLMKDGLKVYGFVVLENHLHLVAQSDDLNRDIARFKAFTARQLIRYLVENNVTQILEQLMFYKKAHKADRAYQVWQEGSHPEWIQNDAMMRQKLEYVHHNPVKRGYVDEPEHWRYSSARNYAGRDGLLDVFVDWSG
jgi:putative transposase